MKANLIEVGLNKAHLFFIKKIVQLHFESPFHFHDLCEINYVVESFGKRIVGDNISNFSSDDFVLMGPIFHISDVMIPAILKRMI